MGHLAKQMMKRNSETMCFHIAVVRIAPDRLWDMAFIIWHSVESVCGEKARTTTLGMEQQQWATCRLRGQSVRLVHICRPVFLSALHFHLSNNQNSAWRWGRGRRMQNANSETMFYSFASFSWFPWIMDSYREEAELLDSPFIMQHKDNAMYTGSRSRLNQNELIPNLCARGGLVRRSKLKLSSSSALGSHLFWHSLAISRVIYIVHLSFDDTW